MGHYRCVLKRIRNTLTNPAWVAFLWTGAIIGVSIIATPVKFTAPTITREIALDVGRVTFTLFNTVELGFLIALLIVVRVGARAPRLWAICGGLALIVLLQSVWLLPELAARTEAIIAGNVPPPSHAHAIYSTLELLKIGTLLYLGFSTSE